MVLVALAGIYIAEAAAEKSALPGMSRHAPAKIRYRTMAASTAAVLVASQAFGNSIHVPDIGLEASAPAVEERVLQD